MIFKINKTVIAYILLYIIGLQSLGIALPGNVFVALFMPIIGFFLLWKLISDKFFINNLLYMIKYSPFIYFCIFYLWSILTILIAYPKGLLSFIGFLTGFIGGLTFSSLFVFITVYILLKENYINLKGVIKFLAIFYLFVFVMGIIQFIGNELDNELIRNFVSLFNNKRLIFSGEEENIFLLKNRVQSIFDEPGGLGSFIYGHLPIIYSISLSKYKIFKNNILNYSVKKLLIPLTILNLLLTKSPIALIFSFIVTGLYFYKIIIKSLKKYYLYIIIIFSAFLCILFLIPHFINIKETYLNRIFISLPNLLNLETLILVEPSLATRIINYIVLIKIGLSNFIFGVGYGAIVKIYLVYLKNSSLPLTQELFDNIYTYNRNPAVAIFYRVFAETGIVGLFLLISFYIKTTIKLIKTKLNLNNITKDFKYGLFVSILIQSTLLLFYGSNLHNTYNIVLFAITTFIIVNRNNIINKEKNLVEL